MHSSRTALFLGIALLGATAVAKSGPLGDLVVKGGFGNARFGAPESEVAVSGGAQSTWAPVNAEVRYSFTEGRLSGVQFTTSSLNASSELLGDLGHALGKTFNEADYQRAWTASAGLADLRWEGNSTGGGVLLVQAQPQQAPPTAPPSGAPTAKPAAAGAATGPLETLLRQGTFRGAAFGASIDSLEGFEPSGQTGSLDTYIRPDEELRFGGVILSEISYFFRNDLLVAIGLHAEAGDETLMLARALVRVLGDPTATDPDAGSVIWRRKAVEIEMRQKPDGSGSIALITRPKAGK